MANTWAFRLESCGSNAIALSFQRRGSLPMPNGVPFALTDEFLTDSQKMAAMLEGFSRDCPECR